MIVQNLTKLANKIANTISPSQQKNSKHKVGLVQISKILANDSPISDKISKRNSEHYQSKSIEKQRTQVVLKIGRSLLLILRVPHLIFALLRLCGCVNATEEVLYWNIPIILIYQEPSYFQLQSTSHDYNEWRKYFQYFYIAPLLFCGKQLLHVFFLSWSKSWWWYDS